LQIKKLVTPAVPHGNCTVDNDQLFSSADPIPSLKLASAKCPELCSPVVVAILATSQDNANLVPSDKDKDKNDQIFRGLMPCGMWICRQVQKMRN
jgi:hypothetical protein